MTGTSIKPDGYLPRVVDSQIERYLRVFGAVEVAGTKWSGKTWTARMHGASMSRLDSESTYRLARTDPAMVLMGERPHVVDEWQRVPAVWDAVRRGVDEERGLKGAWILTGSSTPKAPKESDGDDVPRHSGAGRIAKVRMLPMSLFESGDSTGAVSLKGLFAGEFQPVLSQPDTLGLVELACRGGWPEAIDMETADAQLVAREYLAALYEESVPSQKMNGAIAQRLVASISRNLAQSATYSTLLADMFGAEEDPESILSKQGLVNYLDLLRRLYLVEELHGWEPPARSRKRLQTKPKRYLADPSLAVAQLGMSPEALLADWQTFGLVFENLCIRDLLVYARALEDAARIPLHYYRDDSGLEVDAVVELADGRWAAFEVKVGEDGVEDAVKSLERLRKKLCVNSAARMRPPEFMAVLVGVSEYAREEKDGIYVVPVRAFGP